MPPAVRDSEIAISTIVRLRSPPCGSRMICKPLRHRLDAGVGAAAHRVGAQEEREHAAHARACASCRGDAGRRPRAVTAGSLVGAAEHGAPR